MAEAICSRHYRTFDNDCVRCREARYINDASKKKALERVRREEEFANMALLPKEAVSGVIGTLNDQGEKR